MQTFNCYRNISKTCMFKSLKMQAHSSQNTHVQTFNSYHSILENVPVQTFKKCRNNLNKYTRIKMHKITVVLTKCYPALREICRHFLACDARAHPWQAVAQPRSQKRLAVAQKLTGQLPCVITFESTILSFFFRALREVNRPRNGNSGKFFAISNYHCNESELS